ncbi:MAG: 3-deoxy-manno-octulosonate cytidylyltransferase [Parachlamydiales bacterium]|nr:3-deoxy-manno-octulosonate cytidylyltransferase [Parachlamydiales bacterium]
MSETAVIVIPARMASTRYPNKPMAKINGIAMIERVWRIGKSVKGASDVIIATDDLDLKAFAEGFGAKVIMTSSLCLTGTDRVAEIAERSDIKHTIYFSLQGDAVLTPPWVIEDVLQAMLKDQKIHIATPAVHLQGQALSDFVESKKGGSSSGTTVTFDKKGNAMYFSKALIPYFRDENSADRTVYRHIGLYAYRKDALQQFGQLPEGLFEKSEKLEQLRALENGIPIRVVRVDYRGRTHGSVDRPEDVSVVEAIIEKDGELI